MQFWKNNTHSSNQNPYSADKEMAAGRTEAREKWKVFCQSFSNRHKTGATEFSVRVPITKGNVTERMWVAVSSIDGDKINGTLASKPEVLHDYKLGQQIEIHSANVEDWMYTKGADEYGGFTVIVTLRREVQKLNNLDQKDQKDQKKMVEARLACTHAWAEILNKQIASPHIGLKLSNQQDATLSYLTKINQLMCGNLARDPSPEELAAASGLPKEAISAIWLFVDFRMSHKF
jgi:uncharacterized protein YegJ (DUF2314 family)